MAFCILRMKENSAIKVVITRKERHVDKIEYKLLKRNITIVLKIFFRSETIYKTSTINWFESFYSILSTFSLYSSYYVIARAVKFTLLYLLCLTLLLIFLTNSPKPGKLTYLPVKIKTKIY